MIRQVMLILFFAVSMTACNSVPSRSGAEELIRRQLADEHLYSYEKNQSGPQADFALNWVSGITSPDANTIRVEFNFHWVPTTDAAKKSAAVKKDKQPTDCRMFTLGSIWGESDKWCIPLSEEHVQATAVFVKYDDGWRLKRVYA